MEPGSHHPSVAEIEQAVRSKGGTLSCPLCGREEYAVEEVSVLSAQMSYGATEYSARNWCARTAATC